MLQSRDQFQGVWIPTITPLSETDEIMRSTLLAHYKYLTKFGHAGNVQIKGIIPLSDIGEFASLTYQEKVDILRTLGQESGRAKIMPCIAENSFKDAIKFAQVAENAGADAVVITPPYYFKPLTPEAVYAYYSRIIPEVKLPIFFLHKAPHTHIPIPIQILQKFESNPIIYGVIDSGQDAAYTYDVRTVCPQMLVLSGAEQMHNLFLERGAHGLVSWLGNVYPSLSCELYSDHKQGKLADAQNLQDIISGLIDLMRQYPFPDVLKYALYQRGFPTMISRVPSQRLTEDQKTGLKTNLKKYVATHLKERFSDLFCED